MKVKQVLILACLTFGGCSQTVLVDNEEELSKAIQTAKPGQTILLSKGTWENLQIDFKGMGTEKNPIMLSAEEKGSVFIEGESSVHLSGEYLVVSGLVFRNGHTAGEELISFRTSGEALANNCRVTECVIDDFSNVERMTESSWISLYGKNNRVDHNHIAYKRDKGVTLVVSLQGEESQQNNHQIDHNYFGPRPVFGSNGAETIRLGNSTYSLTFSNTAVEYNYFDRCSGEAEIISNKSCGNAFRFNTFVESQGAFAFRHGHDNLVEGNVFLGNGIPNTGGVRVINENQTVRSNYFYGLTGADFRSALSLMNGVPNSPLIRYNQVLNGRIENNTFINCDFISLGLGSDEERTLPPDESTISKNVFYHDSRKELFKVFDDITGVAFSNNIVNADLNVPNSTGFSLNPMKLSLLGNGLFKPEGLPESTGFNYSTPVITSQEVGVSWYKPEVGQKVEEVIRVRPGKNTLMETLGGNAGKARLLLDPGVYVISTLVEVTTQLTIQSADSTRKSIIEFQGSGLLQLRNGGNLFLSDLEISGEKVSGGNALIRARAPMNRNYKIRVKNCDIHSFSGGSEFHFLDVDKTTFADTIMIENSRFRDIKGTILNLAKEDDDKGMYNAEYILIRKCSFDQVTGMVLTTYRGGTDESTFGPILAVSDCKFSNTGGNPKGASFMLVGTQVLHFESNQFIDSAPIRFTHTVGRPEITVRNCEFTRTPPPVSNISFN